MNPQISRLAHDNLTPMSYVTIMPGQDITTVPAWRQCEFDRAALSNPGTLDLDGVKVIQSRLTTQTPSGSMPWVSPSAMPT